MLELINRSYPGEDADHTKKLLEVYQGKGSGGVNLDQLSFSISSLAKAANSPPISCENRDKPSRTDPPSSRSTFELRGAFEYSYGKNKYETKVLAHCSYYEDEEPDEDGVIAGHVEWDNVSAK